MITIDNLEQMSEFEVVFTSVKHVLANGRPSIDEDTGLCKYSGIGCGAAPFIKIEHREMPYDEVGEGITVSTAWRGLVVAGLAPEKHSRLICILQNAHDSSAQAVARLLMGVEGFVESYKFEISRLLPEFVEQLKAAGIDLS